MIEEFYKKKIIRDFLSLFSESKWKELIHLSLEYGIILLKRNYNVASLSLDDITVIVDDLKEEENKRMKQNMKKFENCMKKDNTKEDVHDESKTKDSKLNPQVNKPSSIWRKGDKTVFDPRARNGTPNKNIIKEREVKKTSVLNMISNISKEKRKTNDIVNYTNIYPEWWGPISSKRNKPNKKNNKNSTKSIHKLDGYHSEYSKRDKEFRSKPRAYSIEKVNNPNFDKNRIILTESKIKSKVLADRKIFNLLKKEKSHPNYMDDDYSYKKEESYNRIVNNNFVDTNKFFNKNEERYETNNDDNEYNSGDNDHNNISYTNNDDYQKETHQDQSMNRDNSKVYATEQSDISHIPKNISSKYYKMRENSSYKVRKNNDFNNIQYNQESINDISQTSTKKNSNYLIEYGKDFTPQIIKEKNLNKDKITKNYNPESIINNSRSNLKQDSYYRNFPTESSNFNNDSSNINRSNIVNRHSINNNDNIYNSQLINNRNEDTILREQMINNYINKNFMRRSSVNNINNKINNEDESNISINRSSNYNDNFCSNNNQNNNESARTHILNDSQMYNYSGRNSCEVISPHFHKRETGNKNTQYNNEKNPYDYSGIVDNQKITKRTLSLKSNSNNRENYYDNYNPHTIQNEEFVKGPVSFQRRMNTESRKIDNEEEDLNQSERLSSYTPSERTKTYFQKDIDNNRNINDSRYSNSNQFKQIKTNKSIITDSISDSQHINNSLKVDSIHQHHNSNFNNQINDDLMNAKLNKNNIQKYNSSGSAYSNQEEPNNTKSIEQKNSYIADDLEQEDLQIFNTAAEELNKRLKEYMERNTLNK